MELGLEAKVVSAKDVLEALEKDPEIPERTRRLVIKHALKALHKAPYHRHQIDANELACLFRPGTRILVHMKFADDEYTHQRWDDNFGPWGDGTYYGITKGYAGDCTVESGSICIPSLYGIKSKYDVAFTVYEPYFCEKIRRKWAEEDREEG